MSDEEFEEFKVRSSQASDRVVLAYGWTLSDRELNKRLRFANEGIWEKLYERRI